MAKKRREKPARGGGVPAPCVQPILLMETALKHACSKNVPVDGLHYIGAARIRAQIQLGVQREQLEGVVVVRSSGRSARTHVADSAPKVLRVDGSVGELGFRGNTTLKFSSSAGDVEDQPVSHVVELLL